MNKFAYFLKIILVQRFDWTFIFSEHDVVLDETSQCVWSVIVHLWIIWSFISVFYVVSGCMWYVCGCMHVLVSCMCQQLCALYVHKFKQVSIWHRLVSLARYACTPTHHHTFCLTCALLPPPPHSAETSPTFSRLYASIFLPRHTWICRGPPQYVRRLPYKHRSMSSAVITRRGDLY